MPALAFSVACRVLCLLIGGCLVYPQAQAVDIYRFLDADGVAHYASSQLDPSYTLFLRGEPEIVQHSTPKQRQYFARHQALLNKYLPTINVLAEKHRVEAALIIAVIEVESRFNAQATSPKGAAGLMQLMPSLAARYGVSNRYDVKQNLEAGIMYLRDLLQLHQGNLALALASYNAGEAAVARHGKRLPPYRETMLYVPQVLLRLQAAREMQATTNTQ